MGMLMLIVNKLSKLP